MRATLSNVNVPKMGGIGLGTTHRVSTEELQKIEAYWRACNYLAGGNDLSARQSSAPRTAQARAYQEAPTGPLGLQYDDLNAIVLAGPEHGTPGVLGPVTAWPSSSSSSLTILPLLPMIRPRENPLCQFFIPAKESPSNHPRARWALVGTPKRDKGVCRLQCADRMCGPSNWSTAIPNSLSRMLWKVSGALVPGAHPACPQRRAPVCRVGGHC